LKQDRTLLSMTQSKEMETVAGRLSDGILITAQKRTTLYKLLMKCFNKMLVRRREGERPFVISGNKILKCILKKDDTHIGTAGYVPRGRRPATSHICRFFVLRNLSLASSKFYILSEEVSVRPLQVHEQETQAETFRCSLIVPQLLSLCCDW
jgi:hypothetical protein